MMEGRPSRLAVVLAVVTGVLVVVLAVAIPLALQDADEDDAPEATTSETEVPSLDAVQVYEDQRTDHVVDEVDYEQAPPVGGPHDPDWLDCGEYDEPVRDENAVHSLEHGAVWVAYAPGIPEEDIDALAGKLPEKGLLSPYEELDSPVAATVWGAQLALDGVDDPRLDLFIEEYEDGRTAPEAYAPC